MLIRRRKGSTTLKKDAKFRSQFWIERADSNWETKPKPSTSEGELWRDEVKLQIQQKDDVNTVDQEKAIMLNWQEITYKIDSNSRIDELNRHFTVLWCHLKSLPREQKTDKSIMKLKVTLRRGKLWNTSRWKVDSNFGTGWTIKALFNL